MCWNQWASNNNTAQPDCVGPNNKEHGGLWSMRSRVSSWLVLGVCIVAFVAIIVIELI
jgi:hypothetical protein